MRAGDDDSGENAFPSVLLQVEGAWVQADGKGLGVADRDGDLRLIGAAAGLCRNGDGMTARRGVVETAQAGGKAGLACRLAGLQPLREVQLQAGAGGWAGASFVIDFPDRCRQVGSLARFKC